MEHKAVSCAGGGPLIGVRRGRVSRDNTGQVDGG